MLEFVTVPLPGLAFCPYFPYTGTISSMVSLVISLTYSFALELASACRK